MLKSKNLLVLIGIVLFSGYFFSCKKDKFTEEDAIRLKDSLQTVRDNQSYLRDSLKKIGGIIQYSVNVVSVGNSAYGKGIESIDAAGAVVTATQNGKVVSLTTGSDGLVIFDDMRIGNVAVNVQLSGHATVNYIADLTPVDNYVGPGQDLSNTIRNAATLVPMFPTSGATCATIEGKVTYEADLTNKTREYPTNAVVIGSIDVTSPLFQNYITPGGGAYNTNQAGRIIEMTFSSFSSRGVVNDQGLYSFQVPATATGLPIKLEVSDYATNQRLLLDNLYGQPVTGVQTVRTLFGSNFTPSSIPNVPPAIVTIDPPTAAIGTYTTAATLNWPTVAGGQVTNITVSNAGAGYTATPNVIINGDGTGATAIATINTTTGAIAGISVTNGGSGYTWATASIYITTYHKTAKAHVNYNSNGNITGVVIDDAGVGYITKPNITITPAVTGLGSGATAVANNPSGGALTSIQVTNGGTNYTGTNYYPGGTNMTITPSGTTFNVISGKTIIKDIYLGTGKREIDY